MKQQKQDALAMLKADHQQVLALFKDYEALSDRSKVSKQRLAGKICTELRVHAELEERLFYPAVRAQVDDDDLMDEALVEHAAAKDLIAQIEELDPEDDLYDARVKVLSEQIQHHVEEEEGPMFAKVRKAGIDLLALGTQMAELKQQLTGKS
ncbi:hemerythrin domain-containing protein [Duganella qianjiadongensis]|uniref:Hemerythrin domain-containing protein n=1 Tax=Duganella qianjiadongensis TaxID=2692176 RepID=A0ABW9VGN3_9BURK|nr:hemerythrin domain-containing protein [Duganella qianjiadongensis]MYM37733.1 hemerythrin domain-containing protein [Duganella qianjiadongensis]